MPDPDQEEFAREVLWQISGLRAELRHFRIQFARFMAHQSGFDEEEVIAKWTADCDALQKKIYLEALEDTGVSPAKGADRSGPEDQAVE